MSSIFARAAIIAASVVFVAVSQPALAQNVHLKPPKANPTFVDQGISLEVVGNIAGLGEGDVVISLTSEDALATATCTNPAGATQPPGQNPAPADVAGVEPIPADEIKNGNLSFDVETEEPTTPIAGAPDCPNPQWTEDITDLSFTNATVTVSQGGVIVLTVTCTFDPATEDGEVPAGDVTCTSS